MPFISIQLNSNRPKQLVEFFDNIEATADAPEDIEVLLHIDAGDARMEELTAYEKDHRRFTLRVLQTNLVTDYSTLWKPLNPLFEMTHADAYFVTNLFDEVRFVTKGWDSIIRRYKDYYTDHIFRLRCSKFRFRNYTDFWECGFAPDSLAFYTRRWLELGGDWNPCLGPDSFQQCIAFYLYTTNDRPPHQQYCRDIAVPDVRFSGEGAGIGLEGEALYNRIAINTRAWFTLMSYKMQEEAKRRAMRLKAHIIAFELGGEEKVTVEEKAPRRSFVVKNRMPVKTLAVIPYQISWIKTTLLSWLRTPLMLYYSGGGEAARRYKMASLFIVFSSHFPYGTKLLSRVSGLVKRTKSAFNYWVGWILKKLPFKVSDIIRAIQKTISNLSPHETINTTWVTTDPQNIPRFAGDTFLLSIRLNGSSAQNITAFLDSIEKTAVSPENIEVVIESQDPLMKQTLEAQLSIRKLALRYAVPGEESKASYFITHVSDGIRFETPGWDKEVEKYIGYYPDHLFRLRCSERRFHNYMSVAECVAAPDTLTFYTRHWRALQDNTKTTFDYSVFQQSVAFYLFTSDPFSHIQYHRDIALPHIRFSGEIAQKNHGVPKVSSGLLRTAKRNAMLLKAHIIAQETVAQSECKKLRIMERTQKKVFQVEKEDGSVLTYLPYNV